MIDQIGGLKHRAFGKRRLKQVILDYHRMTLADRATQISREFAEYQHHEKRRDDVTLIAFKLKKKGQSPG